MTDRLRKQVLFTMGFHEDDRATPWHVTCQICGGGPFAFCKNMTDVNLTKARHRDEHVFAVGFSSRHPAPLEY